MLLYNIRLERSFPSSSSRVIRHQKSENFSTTAWHFPYLLKVLSSVTIQEWAIGLVALIMKLQISMEEASLSRWIASFCDHNFTWRTEGWCQVCVRLYQANNKAQGSVRALPAKEQATQKSLTVVPMPLWKSAYISLSLSLFSTHPIYIHNSLGDNQLLMLE